MRSMREDEPGSVSAALAAHIRQGIADEGGWIPFDRFMHAALYTPGLGYYARDSRQFGLLPSSGSDFVTAPELSPLFGRALAVQVAQGLEATGVDEVWEFGAGSGALAEQLLGALGERVRRYTIVDVSCALRDRQRQRLAPFGDRVVWAERLPAAIEGVVIGNEVLDAMPARLIAFDGTRWRERGVAVHEGRFAWADQDRRDEEDDPAAASASSRSDTDPPDLRPPLDGPFVPGTVTELHPQAQAFVATLASCLTRGLALFIDYGFPEAEYYHPQRTGGTLMCHRGHQSDADPLSDVGLKDITVHVDFTAIALAGQAAGLQVVGYTSQAHFLMNCGLLELMAQATPREIAHAQKLLTEHEMGELFKVIALAPGEPLDAVGFRHGDRSHRL
jgi:SAM-dependent MidA family methyltransferase